jgi:pimeloyl-ACP methyl ester carboxylesterase
MALTAALAACVAVVPSPKNTYVLVHGAFQDRRAWDEIVPRLQAQGHKVIAADLPGRVNGAVPPEQATLDGYRDYVVKLIEAEPGPVVLVGHSFGGFTISAVADKIPQRIRTLVYVAAYLPVSGESMAKIAETDEKNRFNKGSGRTSS